MDLLEIDQALSQPVRGFFHQLHDLEFNGFYPAGSVRINFNLIREEQNRHVQLDFLVRPEAVTPGILAELKEQALLLCLKQLHHPRRRKRYIWQRIKTWLKNERLMARWHQGENDE